MKKNKVMLLGVAAIMSATIMIGCGKEDENVNPGSVSVESYQNEEAMSVQVTAKDGNKISANVGSLQDRAKGANGERPDKEAPDGEIPNGEKPEGEAPNGEKPEGEAPSGEKPNGERPQGDSNFFTESGESIDFTVTDETTITIEEMQQEQDGTIDDIEEGSILEITLDSNQNAKTIKIIRVHKGGSIDGSNTATNGTSANTIDSDMSVTDKVYESTGDDENALRVDGAVAELTSVTIEKLKGESSNTENGDFYGQNAGLLALNGAQVTIQDAVVNTSAVNGNGVFSYGEGTIVNISNSSIHTTQNNSGGIHTTGGGTMIATNLSVETEGNSSAAIRSDRGGGTVNINGGTYTTSGTGSPAIYCTAEIAVEDAKLQANASEGIVVEGKNSVSLLNCDVTSKMQNTYNSDSDENIHGIMIYQSMSGDAAVGEASFNVEGGSITTESGDFIYVTNTDCVINLTDVNCMLANDTFLRVEGNNSSRGWGESGANGGNVKLNASNQQIEGNILVDDISSLELKLSEKSNFTGTINRDGQAGNVVISLSDDSEWELTGDSYITKFDGNVDNIVSNGYHVYVNGEAINE